MGWAPRTPKSLSLPLGTADIRGSVILRSGASCTLWEAQQCPQPPPTWSQEHPPTLTAGKCLQTLPNSSGGKGQNHPVKACRSWSRFPPNRHPTAYTSFPDSYVTRIRGVSEWSSCRPGQEASWKCSAHVGSGPPGCVMQFRDGR